MSYPMQTVFFFRIEPFMNGK